MKIGRCSLIFTYSITASGLHIKKLLSAWSFAVVSLLIILKSVLITGIMLLWNTPHWQKTEA